MTQVWKSKRENDLLKKKWDGKQGRIFFFFFFSLDILSSAMLASTCLGFISEMTLSAGKKKGKDAVFVLAIHFCIFSQIVHSSREILIKKIYFTLKY